MNAQERRETLAAADYWRRIAEHFGWGLIGYTQRYSATFTDDMGNEFELTKELGEILTRLRGLEGPGYRKVQEVVPEPIRYIPWPELPE